MQVKIIEHSISEDGIELITFELRYPRFIHAELMTHRVFSRNASSSRAIPFKKLVQGLTAEPVEWGSNRPGMQAGEELTGIRRIIAKLGWKLARAGAVLGARLMNAAGAHKQIVNRVIEPWSYISVVVTSTEWRNFFMLRNHPDADPTIRRLAQQMQRAHLLSDPRRLKPGEWHLPYITSADTGHDLEDLLAMSAARCARVSYLTHRGERPSISQDLLLFDRLAGSHPLHASPLEHQATPDKRWANGRWSHPKEHGNFVGWRQHRKMVEGEYHADR